MNKPNGNIVVVTVAITFMFVIGGVLWLGSGADQPGDVIKTVIATLAPTLAVIVTLVKVNKVGEDSSALRNGEMESKIENAVRHVLAEYDANAFPDLDDEQNEYEVITDSDGQRTIRPRAK